MTTCRAILTEGDYVNAECTYGAGHDGFHEDESSLITWSEAELTENTYEQGRADERKYLLKRLEEFRDAMTYSYAATYPERRGVTRALDFLTYDV